ncbi:GNAT family N-acetyltransferase [Zobellella iuensis]|uniref:GNAT family N-acetyltransferase n=1 Tax=Zobellella iuensis TaxID=2803811 RepID=A0ABS1QUD6_9GAMM|nr:GNAT family N-acetyltransferase [Zobellella iuensis]MBL1378495.1 GNAT family N-acetyltransferase [Zobellella iuensis]
MNDTQLDKANIDNLTALWRAMGSEPGGMAGLQASRGWPHRFWFDWDHQPELKGHELARLPPRAMVPVWTAGSALERALTSQGFGLVLEQRAMHLAVDGEGSRPEGGLRLSRVLTPAQAECWAALCGRAFGYEVATATVRRLLGADGACLLLASREGGPVATALLFHTGEVVGIHQVGVVPEHRGQGIAHELMLQLMALAREQGARYLTLQASAAGEGLYRRLGFVPRFSFSSYRRG